MSAIDLNKQQALGADPKAIQQNYFTGNLDQPGSTTMFFVGPAFRQKGAL